MGSLLLAIIYVCFISLGLPDSLLGSAWPVMHAEFHAPLSYAGVISMIISIGTIFSSLISGWVVKKIGAGKITAISIGLTAVALLGFSFSSQLWMIFLWAIPYGLGAGGVDSVLNAYVAVHYKSQHMSWLHCMWGVGASASPYIMSFALIRLHDWSYGYLIVAIIQFVLSAFIFISLPLWKTKEMSGGEHTEEGKDQQLTIREIVKIPGAIAWFLTFFGYCSLEVSSSLWTSSYLVQTWDLSPEIASGFASLFYIGMTVGRGINGFLSMKFHDRFLIRLGLGIISGGVVLVLLPFHAAFALVGFLVIGLGCAPIYPCIIHMTPELFGKEKAQAMIGIQLAFAYTGFCIIPTLFGVIANHVSIAVLPVWLLALLVLTICLHESVVKKTGER